MKKSTSTSVRSEFLVI